MIVYTEEGDKLRCTFPGAMHTAACTAVEADLMARVAKAAGPVEFDLGRVDFVASSFLRLCLAVTRKLGRGRLKLVNVQPGVKKVITISGLTELIG